MVVTIRGERADGDAHTATSTTPTWEPQCCPSWYASGLPGRVGTVVVVLVALVDVVVEPALVVVVVEPAFVVVVVEPAFVVVVVEPALVVVVVVEVVGTGTGLPGIWR